MAIGYAELYGFKKGAKPKRIATLNYDRKLKNAKRRMLDEAEVEADGYLFGRGKRRKRQTDPGSGCFLKVRYFHLHHAACEDADCVTIRGHIVRRAKDKSQRCAFYATELNDAEKSLDAELLSDEPNIIELLAFWGWNTRIWL